jgi:DNA polymerase III epsilon subunit-like protein
MYLFFDTETNGLPRNWKAPISQLSNWPRLVQIAWILFDNEGNEMDRNDHIVKPNGFTISADSSSIHGITTEKALSEGIELQSVLEEFNDQITKAKCLVAHNMSFDEKIMGAEFLRIRQTNTIAPKAKICTMKSTTDYVAILGYYGNKWPTLSELHYKLFGVDFEEAHNAAADINATARCFWEARRRGIL